MTSLSDFQFIGPVAYQGKADCDSAFCTRWLIDGKLSKDCVGWHCVYCDAPTSYQGHRCDAGDAILGEAQRQAASATETAEPSTPKDAS